MCDLTVIGIKIPSWAWYPGVLFPCSRLTVPVQQRLFEDEVLDASIKVSRFVVNTRIKLRATSLEYKAWCKINIEARHVQVRQ